MKIHWGLLNCSGEMRCTVMASLSCVIYLREDKANEFVPRYSLGVFLAQEERLSGEDYVLT